MELFIWIDCLRRASAKRVTAVIPYFGYARQDRKDEGRTPITAKLVANLIERAGADRVVSVDLHAAQVQGFFDIPVDHLYAGAGADQVVQEPEADEPRVRLAGRRQREAGAGLRQPCSAARSASSTSAARAAATTEAKHIIGDVEGKNVLMVDDMITTAGTMTEAVQDPAATTARRTSTSPPRTRSSPRRRWSGWRTATFTKLAVTDTIPIGNRCDAIKDRLVVLSVAELLGEAIHRIHHNESVSALFAGRQPGRALSE